jgi:DNA-binding NtrC family response regulator
MVYAGSAPTLHLRRCTLLRPDTNQEWAFEREEVSIGAMDDNDVVLPEEAVSRYHCKIVQDDSAYVLVDLDSTNGTFINGVRIREGFLRPGCTVEVGQRKLVFNAREERVEITPSAADRCVDIIGQNGRMREIYAIIEKIAPTATTVVIEGETGTGKEVVAQSIHKLSRRAGGPLIIFDCGAVPPNLIESELFGHEKGSFTGAVMTRQGLFEMADGGTLFLDEMGELPLDLQPKLLRCLEQREVRRVGAAKPSRVDVRIIAATNRNLEEEVAAGRFRQDLYYRLSVVRLQLPSLRERPDDIPLLVTHFLKNQRYNRGPDGAPKVSGIAPDALRALQGYSWPGNVRELVNVVERAVSFCDGPMISLADLPEPVREARGDAAAALAQVQRQWQPERPAPAAAPIEHFAELEHDTRPPPGLVSGDVTFKDAKEQWVASFEREYIINLLKRHGGNISHAARDADIDRKYFRKLMRKYDIEASVGHD